MRWLCLLLLLTNTAVAQTRTTYAPDGRPLMQQRRVGDRLVDYRMDGTPIGYWIREGSFLNYRKMDGTLVQRTAIR